ncbi:MAG TPA: flagellin [Candidatus Binatia bacterium]|nr:flagellin [Candidatus Binatia bacterium]
MTSGPSTSFAGLGTQQVLAQAQAAFAASVARLSSGLRILSAATDPAGLAIAGQLDQSAAVDGQAAGNVAVGLAAVQTADQALGQIGDVNARLATLATEASNGMLTDAERGAVQQELGALTGEIDRIAATTTLGGVQLLQPGSTVTVQAGGGSGDRIAFQTVDASATGLGLAGADVSTQAGAQAALAATATAADAIARARSGFAAVGARLAAAAQTLGAGREQAIAAAGRIQDTSYAEETGAAARTQTLVAFAMAALARANRQQGLLVSRLA